MLCWNNVQNVVGNAVKIVRHARKNVLALQTNILYNQYIFIHSEVEKDELC